MPTFPLLADGAKTQFPYTEGLRFQTLSVVTPAGERFPYAERATPFRSWVVGGPSVSDADLATLRAFFEARRGKWERFDFVEPRTNTTYSNCRFDQDSFDFTALGPDENQVAIRIVQVP